MPEKKVLKLWLKDEKRAPSIECVKKKNSSWFTFRQGRARGKERKTSRRTSEREIPLAAELDSFSVIVGKFAFGEKSHFTTLISSLFCSLIRVSFYFTAVRLNLLFGHRDDETKTQRFLWFPAKWFVEVFSVFSQNSCEAWMGNVVCVSEKRVRGRISFHICRRVKRSREGAGKSWLQSAFELCHCR